jgi:cell division protein FtsI/penicillin-binding protein 2
MMKPAPTTSATKNSYNVRIFLLLFLILIVLGLVGVRLFFLQVVNHGYYQALADGQHNDPDESASPNRGEIYLTSALEDSQPVLVATNITKDLVYANERQIANPATVAGKLAPILGMDKAEIEDKLTGSSAYSVIKKELDDSVSAQITALDIKGIYLEPQTMRFYPEGDLASQVLGFVGYSGDQRVGQYGVEGQYEKELAGTPAVSSANAQASGSWTIVARKEGRRYLSDAGSGDSI